MRFSKEISITFIILFLLSSCNRNITLEKQKAGERFSKVNIFILEKLAKTHTSNFNDNIKIHLDKFHKTDDYWITIQNDSSLTTYFVDKENNYVINIKKDFWDTKNTTRTISNYYPSGNLKNTITYNYSKKSLNDSPFQNISQNNRLLHLFSYTETKKLDKLIFFDEIYTYSVDKLINNLYKYIDDKDSEINIYMIYSNDFITNTNSGLYSFEVTKDNYPF